MRSTRSLRCSPSARDLPFLEALSNGEFKAESKAKSKAGPNAGPNAGSNWVAPLLNPRITWPTNWRVLFFHFGSHRWRRRRCADSRMDCHNMESIFWIRCRSRTAVLHKFQHSMVTIRKTYIDHSLSSSKASTMAPKGCVGYRTLSLSLSFLLAISSTNLAFGKLDVVHIMCRALVLSATK